MKFDGRNEAAQAVSSMLSSRAVQFQVPQTTAQDAAEEVGMLFSQKVESSSKELTQRKLRTLDPQIQRIQGIEQLSELYEQLGHPGQLSLGQLARQVRQELLLTPDVDSLLTLTGGDPARTHVVLQHVTDQAKAQGREIEAALARDFQVQVQARYHPQIQAGMNIALALKTADGDAALRQAVRVLYYSSVVMKQSLVNITHPQDKGHDNSEQPDHWEALCAGVNKDGRGTAFSSSWSGGRVAINTSACSPGASHGRGQTLTARVLVLLHSLSSMRTRLWLRLCKTRTATL